MTPEQSGGGSVRHEGSDATVSRWAKRLERVLADAPAGVEVLVTHGSSLVCVEGTHAEAMEAGGVAGENDAIEAGTLTKIDSRVLAPYGESL